MARNSAEEPWEKHLRALGVAVERIARHGPDGHAEGPEITEIRFKMDADDRTSVLVIMKATEEGGKLVGFVGGPDLQTAVMAVAKKLKGGAVRWREDRPWGEREVG